jgi:hypothetical protein
MVHRTNTLRQDGLQSTFTMASAEARKLQRQSRSFAVKRQHSNPPPQASSAPGMDSTSKWT